MSQGRCLSYSEPWPCLRTQQSPALLSRASRPVGGWDGTQITAPQTVTPAVLWLGPPSGDARAETRRRRSREKRTEEDSRLREWFLNE